MTKSYKAISCFHSKNCYRYSFTKPLYSIPISAPTLLKTCWALHSWATTTNNSAAQNHWSVQGLRKIAGFMSTNKKSMYGTNLVGIKLVNHSLFIYHIETVAELRCSHKNWTQRWILNSVGGMEYWVFLGGEHDGAVKKIPKCLV